VEYKKMTTDKNVIFLFRWKMNKQGAMTAEGLGGGGLSPCQEEDVEQRHEGHQLVPS